MPTWTWQAVEDRMAEALRNWWRSTDNDARFSLGGRISSAWRNYCPDRMDLIVWGALKDVEADAPAPLPLSRADMERMAEASEWMRHVPEDDRRLVVLALTRKAAGDKKVPWLKLKRRLGVQHGADGLRKRYSRALTDVCLALNGEKMPAFRDGGLSTRQTTPPSK